MTKKVVNGVLLAFLMLVFLVAAGTASATQTVDTKILPSGFACGQCHNGSMPTAGTEWTSWSSSAHAKTQADPADELSSEDIGLTPAQKIPGTVAGSDPEDCISCHSPTSVLANGGMTETDALGYFFTTAISSGTATDGTTWTSGTFYPGTTTQHESDWADVACSACHDVSKGHPSSLNLTLFASHKFSNALTNGSNPADATAAAETPITGPTSTLAGAKTPSELCGQCHGSLQAQNRLFNTLPYWKWAKAYATDDTSGVGHPSEWTGTDHLIYDGWKLSKHGNTQAALAGNGHAGPSCLMCHAPTATNNTRINGGMTSSAAAWNYFFAKNASTGAFTALHTDQWPNVGCIVCHDPHYPDNAKNISFLGTDGKRVPVTNSSDLCGQCHGNLRTTSSYHLSYNIIKGTGVTNINGTPGLDGGVGVTDQKTMPGATCVDCHMYVNPNQGEDTTQTTTHGHTWQVITNGGWPDTDNSATANWGWDLGAFAGDTTNPDGNEPHVATCSKCHTFTTDAAIAVIAQWKSDYATLKATTTTNVNAAKTAMAGVNNASLQADLNEAVGNLTYAGGDESGGFHNHKYTMALLNDANDKALEVINANPQSAPSTASSSGGGCTINPNAGFNATLPLLIILSLFYFYYRSRKQNS